MMQSPVVRRDLHDLGAPLRLLPRIAFNYSQMLQQNASRSSFCVVKISSPSGFKIQI
jgi:hypothetical protein